MHKKQQFGNLLSSTLSRVATAAMGIIFVLALTFILIQSAQAQTFKVIYNFTGGSDGLEPQAGLTIDKAGSLYGTAIVGGRGGYGTVFKLAHVNSGWIFTTLYSFTDGSDGAQPRARLVFGPDGSLYGTTTQGGGGNGCGGQGCGTIFRLRPAATACKTALCPWSETVLYRFTGALDGGEPSGAVTFDQAGNIYGTTAQGGPQSGNCFLGSCGTVYKLTSSNGNWTESVLYSFAGGTDGQWPVGSVIFDSAGSLYGSTNGGGFSDGSYGYGTVFQLTPSAHDWSETILHAFQGGNDGQGQQDSPILDRSGNLYGTTAGGGVSDGGKVYELTPSNGSWTLTTLYDLTGKAGPGGGVIMDAAGNLYATTQLDGVYKKGSAFKLTPSNNAWMYTSLHDFAGGRDGKLPYCSLAMDANGNFYGTTSEGGTHGYGVVFEVTP
jgi:uncharacterized repeat protein (TIGR03803 family)